MSISRFCRSLFRKLRLAYSDWTYLNMFSDSPKKEDEVLFSLLRKSCHILDKGLNAVPFEKGHAKKVYYDAVCLRKAISDKEIMNDPAFLWCNDVIGSYEKAQSGAISRIDNSFHIYNENEKLWIYDFIESRVSCRNFTNDTIEDFIWDEIIKIAADAPNGCCRQTTRAYIVHDSETVEKLKANISGATGFSNGIPYLICVTADTRPYYCIDRMFPYIDSSLFIGNLILACRANNIFSTILNFQHPSNVERRNVTKLLNIPPYEQIILFIAAGYVHSVPAKPVRMSVNRFRKL